MSLIEILEREDMIHVAVALSWLTSYNDYGKIATEPISSTFSALVVGSIVGGMLQELTAKEFRPFVAGGLLLIAGGTILARSTGLWTPKTRN